jgi:purine nucleosidase/pyrimidine-specific ribonucleoside hydrolase
MGGVVREAGNVTPFAEFNIAADPKAADIVLRSGIPITLVPLDVTRKVTADRGFCERLAARGGKTGRTAAAMIEAYLGNIAALRAARGIATKGAPIVFPLHDPCVTLYAIDAGLFGAEQLPIRVVTDRSEREGETVIDDARGVAVTVLTQARREDALALAFTLLRDLP